MSDGPRSHPKIEPQTPAPIFPPTEIQGLIEETTTNFGGALYVNVDFLDLVEHHGGDMELVWQTLADLKDLLA